MAHYDCDDCGAGMGEEHSDGCKEREAAYVASAHFLYTNSTKNVTLPYIVQAEAPTLGLRPKHIVQQERVVEILEAMLRLAVKGNAIPLHWAEEFVELNKDMK